MGSQQRVFEFFEPRYSNVTRISGFRKLMVGKPIRADLLETREVEMSNYKLSYECKDLRQYRKEMEE